MIAEILGLLAVVGMWCVASLALRCDCLIWFHKLGLEFMLSITSGLCLSLVCDSLVGLRCVALPALRLAFGSWFLFHGVDACSLRWGASAAMFFFVARQLGFVAFFVS